ncbi:MAG: peptidase [Clostridiales bacterium]|jgi:putative protease|nr:peptidase [Clostridiales bacterium]
MFKPEILAPAGDLEKLKFACIYGADAVYLGGRQYGLRAAAGNFSLEEIKEGVSFAHSRGKKVYVTVNIFAHNKDLISLPDYLGELTELDVDGVIVSDPGIIRIVRQVAPLLPLHLSTQANMTNWSSALFWKELGFQRLVLARELSLQEISEISSKVDIELEAFVHGAMCMSYSGRCIISNFLTGRGANQGECAHPCRYKYYLVEEKRPGECMPVEEDERGSYIFNSRDLCMLPHLKDLVEAGIHSFKIEGRMKSIHYVATVVKAYREVLDSCIEGEENSEQVSKWLNELKKVSHRGYTTGFYYKPPTAEDHNYETSSYIREYEFIGIVKGYSKEQNAYEIEQRNRFAKGETIELFTPSGEIFTYTINHMKNEEGESIDAAPHPQQIVYLPLKQKVEPFTILRRKK